MFDCQLVVSSCMCEEQPHPSCFAFMREDNWAFCVLASFKFSQSVYKTVISKMSTFLSILVEISQWFQNYSVRKVPSKTGAENHSLKRLPSLGSQA